MSAALSEATWHRPQAKKEKKKKRRGRKKRMLRGFGHPGPAATDTEKRGEKKKRERGRKRRSRLPSAGVHLPTSPLFLRLLFSQ